jgi:hypothetical protein
MLLHGIFFETLHCDRTILSLWPIIGLGYSFYRNDCHTHQRLSLDITPAPPHLLPLRAAVGLDFLLGTSVQHQIRCNDVSYAH